MKKIVSVFLCISLITVGAAVFTACSNKNQGNANSDTSDTEREDLLGGWTRAESPAITEDFKKVFENATATVDWIWNKVEPVAYLQSQVVAGTNHCVLCEATTDEPDAKTTYVIVFIYEDLEGNAEVTQILSSDSEAEISDDDGGWNETSSPEMTKEAEAAFEKACETLTGAEYTPVALLSTQIVAGTNYRIICESRPSVPFPESGYVIITVSSDLNGNSEILDTVEFRHKDILQDTHMESETDGGE